MLSCGFQLADGDFCRWAADDLCRDIISRFAAAANMEIVSGLAGNASYYSPEKWQMTGVRLRALFYSGLLPYLESGRAGVFHGILVNNVLVCGVSGVGKTTLCRRLDGIADIYADDAVLVQVTDGKLTGKPCPTWSRYIRDIEAPHSCDINKSIVINKLLFLERGDTPGIHPLPSSLLTAKLMRASSDLYYRIFSSTLSEERLAALSSAQLALSVAVRSCCDSSALVVPLTHQLPEDFLSLLKL